MTQVVITKQKVGFASDAVALARSRDLTLASREHQLLAGFVDIDVNDRAGAPLALEDLLGQRVFQFALDAADERRTRGRCRSWR